MRIPFCLLVACSVGDFGALLAEGAPAASTAGVCGFVFVGLKT